MDAMSACKHSIGPDDHDRMVALHIRNTKMTLVSDLSDSHYS